MAGFASLELMSPSWRAAAGTAGMASPDGQMPVPITSGSIALAHIARDTDPGAFNADVAFATGLPADRVVAIGKRTIRRTAWLSRITADEGLRTRAAHRRRINDSGH